jgi:toxin FitB
LTRWLLDTNVVSELRKPRPERKVVGWIAAQSKADLLLSRVTIAEIRFGISRAGNPNDRARLTTWLENEVLPWFRGRIVEVDEAALVEWRMIMERGRQARHTFPQPDALIAAVAVVNSLTVATRNTEDFAKAGVAVVNPWNIAPP